MDGWGACRPGENKETWMSHSRTPTPGPENCLLLTVAQTSIHFICNKGSETRDEKFYSRITFPSSDIYSDPKEMIYKIKPWSLSSLSYSLPALPKHTQPDFAVAQLHLAIDMSRNTVSETAVRLSISDLFLLTSSVSLIYQARWHGGNLY